MKKRLLFLTILCFSLVLMFTACGEDETGELPEPIEVDGFTLQLSLD